MSRQAPRRTFDKSTVPPIETIAERLIGPPDKIEGDRLKWRCPFHDERTPSFTITRGNAFFKCFGCPAKGDGIKLVRMHLHLSFPEAIAWLNLADEPPSTLRGGPRHREPPAVKPSQVPDDAWQAIAWKIIAGGEGMLWTAAGDESRAYLHDRGLTTETIRSARLGVFPRRAKIDGIFVHDGILIPWIEGEAVTAINIRRPAGSIKPDGTPSRYEMVKGSHRGIFPSRAVIRDRKPLAIAEGEFDALLLDQELYGMIPVITLGSASSEPKADVAAELSRASTLLIAVDADKPGEKSVENLAKRGRNIRVRPPGKFKDWTEAHQAGFDILANWLEHLITEDKRYDFQERAAIMEFDGGLDRRTAVLKAFAASNVNEHPAAGSNQLFTIDTCKPTNYCGR